jgi:uncharacterized lipoprotein YddW (UPF0748 family)
MPYYRAYHEGFQDWRVWLDSGLVDFVTLMNYLKETPKYEKYVLDTQNRTGKSFKKVNFAIGAYAMGDLPETFAEQFKFCEKTAERACVVFHYESLLEHPALISPLRDKEALSSYAQQ